MMQNWAWQVWVSSLNFKKCTLTLFVYTKTFKLSHDFLLKPYPAISDVTVVLRSPQHNFKSIWQATLNFWEQTLPIWSESHSRVVRDALHKLFSWTGTEENVNSWMAALKPADLSDGGQVVKSNSEHIKHLSLSIEAGLCWAGAALLIYRAKRIWTEYKRQGIIRHLHQGLRKE